MTTPRTLWLRAETKPDEHRSGLTPLVCQKLLATGDFKIFVEKCNQRFFDVKEYADVGCTIVEHGSWRTAPEDAFIVGLKELPENDNSPLKHRHIFFGHCFKYQTDWKVLLNRFESGGGKLLDMEFLTDEKGRRVAAFGYHAGFAGMAVAIDVWCHQQLTFLKIQQSAYPAIEAFQNEEALVSHIKTRLSAVLTAKGSPSSFPKCHVMGALGRCGSGAVDFARLAGIPEERIIKWDMAETKVGGPFPAIMESDIFVNCIYLMSKIPPFLTEDLIKQGGPLSVVCDVSCDYTNPNNPLPIYNRATTFRDPLIHLTPTAQHGIDVIAIDHLPTLLPRESSDRFGLDLLPTLLALKDYEHERVWQDSLALFEKKVIESHEK